ncbi:type II secretory pathway pseudopilin PulG [Lactobacillus colini]|uniref:Type II secretory pathway pseudopilin PulG n=1 Tax=Lactobacillus colini TaxID=1819254 RepID=A0ABS4MDY6_9LACO|nr:hypothetical protein [Lactobacillus colini]MBP2057869.1 type II secretory pathway pseudopilin PulG [Lactobacillus colini]
MELSKVQRIKAFTLAETIIITFIVAFLALVPALYLRGYQESVDLLNAKRSCRTAINYAARQAALTHSIRIVEYDTNKQQIKVRSGNQGTKRYKLPDNINIYGFPINISQDGNLTPRTITFVNNNQRVKIKIQMMWGKMVDG